MEKTVYYAVFNFVEVLLTEQEFVFATMFWFKEI